MNQWRQSDLKGRSKTGESFSGLHIFVPRVYSRVSCKHSQAETSLLVVFGLLSLTFSCSSLVGGSENRTKYGCGIIPESVLLMSFEVAEEEVSGARRLVSSLVMA